MRIRKHAKITPLILAAAPLKSEAILQPHVCQLNQSPWDVMSFSPPSTPQPPSQADRNDVSAGNGNSGNRISLAERELNTWRQPEYARRITTTAVATAAPVAAVAADKEEEKMEVEPPEKKEEFIQCCKTDGKTWQCKYEAVKGNSLCEHHKSLMKSYSHSTTTKKSAKQAAAAAPPPRPRPKKFRKSSSSANEFEFYYYSGFGPRWGKKRGKVSGDCGGSNNTNNTNNNNILPEDTRIEQEIEASAVREEDSDYVEYEEEEEYVQENKDNNNNGKKRVRKPIKARSLKSLM